MEFENKLCPHSYKESQISVAPGLLPCLITRQELHLKIILFLATRLEMSDCEKKVKGSHRDRVDIFSQLNVIGGSKFKPPPFYGEKASIVQSY